MSSSPRKQRKMTDDEETEHQEMEEVFDSKSG